MRALRALLEGLKSLAVAHEVGGGGGAHGAEALEEAEDEEDERFGGMAQVDEPAGAFKRSVLEAAAEVERVTDRVEGGAEARFEESRRPEGAGSEDAGEDGARGDGGALRRAGSGGGDDGDRGAEQGSDGGGFAVRVEDYAAREGGLNFEDRVDAFGGDVKAGGVREQERRIEIIKDGEVDLAGAAAGGVDDEGGSGAVTAGEIALKQIEPMLFGGGTGGGGVLEEAAEVEASEHFLLDAAEDGGEIDFSGIGKACHARPGYGRELGEAG